VPDRHAGLIVLDNHDYISAIIEYSEVHRSLVFALDDRVGILDHMINLVF